MPTTELEAVNTILETIGQSPVTTLTASGVLDAEIAKRLLAQASRDCQTEGWHWNKEYDYPISPDAQGYINVPSTALEIEVARTEGRWKDLVRRGSRMYDRRNRTYVFSEPVKFDWTQQLDFTDLPQAARHYITILAALRMQNRALMSDTVEGYTNDDLGRARAVLEAAEHRTNNHNFLNDSFDTHSIVHRNR